MITSTPLQHRVEQQITALRRLLGQRLFRATLVAMPATGEQRRLTLDACLGRRQLPIGHALEQMELLIDLLGLCRRRKAAARPRLRPQCGNPAPWEQGTLAERVERMFCEHAEDALRHSLNCHPSGDCEIAVRRGVQPYGVTATSRCRGPWRSTDLDITANLPADWLATVHRCGMATAGDMFTVWAVSLGLGIYHALWARQGRGYSVRMERGWLATDGQSFYHSTRSATHALRGLTLLLK